MCVCVCDVCGCTRAYECVHVCEPACVTLRIIGYRCVCVSVCVAARLREINTRYDRKMKALLWVTTEHRGRVGTHTLAHAHTHISPSCLLVMWVQ